MIFQNASRFFFVAFLALTLGCGAWQGSVQAPSKRVVLLFMADLHAQLETHPELFWQGQASWIKPAGGLARVGGYVRACREANPAGVLFVDLGDTFQGSGPASLSKGRALIGPMNALKPDVALPGNWEVAYGAKSMRELAKALEYPTIAANVYEEKTKALVFPPYILADLNGVHVAVIGFTDPDVPKRQPPSYSEGLGYAREDVLPPFIQAVRKKGADIVVLATHVGLIKAIDLARRLEGVDIVLSGDTHERTFSPVQAGSALVLEPGAFGSFLGRLDFTVRSGKLEERSWKLLPVTPDRFMEDAQVKEAVAKALGPFSGLMGETIGETLGPLYRDDVLDAPLDHVITDAMREAAGTDIALSNGFRFGPVIEPGKILEADLWCALPDPEPLKVGRVYGWQLRTFLEEEIDHVFPRNPGRLFGGWLPRFSGMKVFFEASAQKGRRLKEVFINGSPLQEERLYSVVSCQREGDPTDEVCRIPHVLDARVLDTGIHEAVKGYLARHSPIPPQDGGRMVALDLPKAVHSQYEALFGPSLGMFQRPFAF